MTMATRRGSSHVSCTPVTQIVGSAVAAQGFFHPSDSIVAYTVTVPSASNVGVVVRAISATNLWSVYVTSAGAFGLSEVIDGAGNVRANVNGIISTGDRISVLMYGSTIQGYSANTLRWTYALATNFSNGSGGSVSTLGTGGGVSSLKVWHLRCRHMEGIGV